MSGTFTIYRRELAGLFLAPLAWILLCATVAYCAFFFVAALEQGGGEVNLALSYMHGGPFWFLVVFLPPLLTMRMISEETKSGLLEFLLTAPVGDAGVVLGKMLAATTFMAIAWSCVLLYGALVHALGAPPDWGQLVAQWIGALAVSALLCTLGLIASALSATPLLAAFLGILGNIVLLILPMTVRLVRGEMQELARAAVHKVDVTAHFNGSFATGAVDTGDLVFFGAWTLAGLFCAVRVTESRRWLG